MDRPLYGRPSNHFSVILMRFRSGLKSIEVMEPQIIPPDHQLFLHLKNCYSNSSTDMTLWSLCFKIDMEGF